MEVKLIGLTQPIPGLGLDWSEDLIAYCARVSNPNNQDNAATGPKLIKYLMDHKHFSPFEMVNMLVQIDCTRDISRQILRHDMHFQEYSLRYATADLGFELSEARLQDTKNRQNSLDCDDPELRSNWDAVQRDVIEVCKSSYDWAISQGIAKEQARKVLPEGLTLSRLYVNGTVRNFYFYCKTRMDDSSQKEHRLVAEAVWNILLENYPSLKGL